MVDFLKKASLLTAEVLSLAADKVQEVADDFVKKGTIHDTEAKKFVSEVRTTLESREKEIVEKWEQIVQGMQQISNTLGLPAKGTEDTLDNKIDELEKQLDDLRARREVVVKEHKKEAAPHMANAAKAKANV